MSWAIGTTTVDGLQSAAQVKLGTTINSPSLAPSVLPIPTQRIFCCRPIYLRLLQENLSALRVLDYGPEPAVLVCHGIGGRRWFRRGKGIPDRWFPRDELDAESNAFEALHCGLERPLPFVIGADAWFERREAERYEVFEQTVSAGGGDILTLLTFKDAEMLD
jgi:hypothetical protein